MYAAAPLAYSKYMRDCDVLLDAENGIPFFTPLYSRRPTALLMFHVHRDVLLRELPPPLSWFTWALEVWFMPRVYRRIPFIAISESTRDEIIAHRYTRLPVTLVHSGVDHDVLWPSKKSQVPTVAYLGRVVRYKRIRELLEAFVNVRRRVPDAVLHIAGTGNDLQPCRDLAKQLKIDGSTTFEGSVDEQRKRELLASAWVFAQPSRVEGWGISVIEAGACGTPAVAMRVPGLRDAIVHGKTGLLAQSWHEFADAVTYILRDDSYRTCLSKNALERSKEFSWKASADRLLGKLQEIAQGS